MNDGADVVETGVITGVVDCGTIVRFFIETHDGLFVTADADGNMGRSALESSGVRPGDNIEFQRTDWGGLAWFVPLNTREDE